MEKDVIIYIGGFELPDKNAAAHRVVANAKALREIGYRVVFIDIDRTTNRGILDTKTECYGFERYSMQYKNKRLYNIDDLKQVCELYSDDVSAVIAYNYPGIALWKMLNYCHAKGVRIIADCTEWYGMLGDNFIKRIVKGFDSYLRMNIIQPKLDGMIAISRYLGDFYKDKLPTIVVPPMVDITDSKWTYKTINNDKIIEIIYAGTPGRHKDKINKIVEALAIVDNEKVWFTVIGITKEQFLEYYPEEEGALKKLNDRVVFLGRLTHEESIRHLIEADFSMFYRDITRVTMAGFPTKFVEAITSGTLVITNKTSDLEEYLDEGRNGFWVDEDIAKTLEKIMSIDSESLTTVRRNIKQNIFDYHNYVEKFMLLF